MAIVYSQPYRPITLNETGDTNALSVRDYRDAARNTNLLRNYITPWQLHVWPPTVGKTVNAVETYAAQFGPLPWIEGFSTIRVEINARSLGDPQPSMSVKVYGYMFPFVGSGVIGAGSFNGLQTVSTTITGVGASYAWYTTTLAQPIPYDLRDPVFYLIVTGDGATAGDALWLRLFDAWPVPVADVA